MDVDPDGTDTSDPSLDLTNASGQTGASNLKTGTYWVTEDSNGPTDNYHFLDSYCTVGDVATGNSGTSSFGGVEVKKDQTTFCTFVNVRDTGTITIDKITYPSGETTTFDINLNQGSAADPTLIHTSTLADQDTPDTFQVITGSYWLEEILPASGWDLTNANCTVNKNSENIFDPRADEFTVNSDDNIYCTYENTKRGQVNVIKYNDLNGNGSHDDGEAVLSDWGINLAHGESLFEATTDEHGEVNFPNLIPGSYLLSEDLQTGWNQTNISCSNNNQEEFFRFTRLDLDNDNSHIFEIEAGDDLTCEIGNQPAPALTIEKSNDAVGNKNPNDIVTFTLKLVLTGSSLTNVIVTDITPPGFTYVAGSWTSSKAGVGEPNYSSPAVWNVGNMNPGEDVTLTYQAKISADQDGGTYNDIAWAQGTSQGWGTILAQGINSEYIEGLFVGTDVTIGENNQQTGAVNVEKTGEVLGASIELPATGINSLYLALALALAVIGLFFILGGKMFKKS